MSTETLNAGTADAGAGTSAPATSTPAGDSQTPAFSPGQAPEVTTDKGAVAPASGTPGAAPVVPPVFAPNLKFKVLDKEHEIDPLFAGIIKDADTEKKVKELFEKAYGLDSVKVDRQMLKEKIEKHYAPLEKSYQGVQKSIQQIDTMIEQGDYDNFFNALQIPEQKILQWAVKKAQLMNLTPQEQEAYNQQVQERNQLYQLQQQNADFQEQLFQTQVQARAAQLSQELSKPEVLNAMSSFDTRAGVPGAFRNEVIKRGQFYAHQGVDAPVEQVVKEVLQLVGQVVPQAPGPQQPADNSAGMGGQAPQGQAPTPKPPVIPNVGGQGTSPAKRVVRSLDDIRALAKQQS
jgi:hypothetical protein